MRYIIVCLLLIGCGSVTAVEDDAGDSELYSDVGLSRGGTTGRDATVDSNGGAGGSVSTDLGTGGSVSAGSGGSITTPGTGGMPGTGGADQATGGNSGSGGTTPSACGLDLTVCPNTVRSVYFSLAYSIPGDVTGDRTPRICAINANGNTVVDNRRFFDDVRCGYCATGKVNGKREVLNCLIKNGTVINVSMQQPITTNTDIYCLPRNGVCPDVDVKYSKWYGTEFIDGDQ